MFSLKLYHLLTNPIAKPKTWLGAASLCLLIALTGCASSKDKGDEELSKAELRAQRLQKDIKETEAELYETAQRALRRRQYSSAKEALLALEENFPFGSYAEQAQLELIYAYHQAGEYEAAIAAADRFIRLHPTHRQIDYAYYMRGVSSFYQNSAIDAFLISDISTKDLGSARESMDYFTQLIHKYPKSHYVLDAQTRMTFLRNLMARQEIQVANYYFKRGAFVAAAGRGRFVVEQFQGAPAVPDGLAVMAHAYHLLGYKELSDSAIQTLHKNFPDYPAFDKDGNFSFDFAEQKEKSLAATFSLGLLKPNNNIYYDTRKIYNPKAINNFADPKLEG